MVIYWWTQTKIRSLRWWFMFTEELPWRNAPKTCFLMKAFFIEVERFWFSSCLILRQSPCPSLPDPAHLLRLPHPPLASISIITVLAGISQITDNNNTFEDKCIWIYLLPNMRIWCRFHSTSAKPNPSKIESVWYTSTKVFTHNACTVREAPHAQNNTYLHSPPLESLLLK